MLNRIACLICSICFVITAHSQAQQDEKTFSNDLGFNTNIILQNVFNSTGAPFSLMYKRYTTETKAWRFGLNCNFLVVNPTQSGTNNNNNTVYVFNNNVSVALSVGKEVQRVITNKWIWYYGGDLVPGYTSYTTDQYSPIDVKIMSTSSVAWHLVARPFIGLRFNISKQLYVSTEFSVNLSYTHTNRHEENVSNNLISDSSTTAYAFGLSPASALFLFYRF